MTYPTLRDWLFSIRTFAAAMLALYLALKFELPRPYWAMASVYVASNPFVGQTRSKALHRAMGTLTGAAAGVIVVPPFVEMPFIFSAVVACWTGTMLYLAMSHRTARGLLIKCPARWRRVTGSTARVTLKVPNTLVAHSRSMASSSISSNGPNWP
jgi:uncharacterized membrane protein YccC